MISFHCFPSPEQISPRDNFKLTNDKYHWTRIACTKTVIHYVKKIGINQLHIPRNLLCLDISSLITYKQTSCVCSVQGLSPLHYKKFRQGLFAKNTNWRSLEIVSNVSDLMTNYSDGWIFGCCEHSTQPFRNRYRLVVCISMPTLHFCFITVKLHIHLNK